MSIKLTEQEIDEVVSTLKKKDVRFIRLQFSDILGIPKDVEIPVGELSRSLKNGQAFDGSSVEGFARIFESDMYLYPDVETLRVYPWKSTAGSGDEYANARIICDVQIPDGEPFEGDPRYVLKKVHAEAEEVGLKMYAGPEPEFFMFKGNSGAEWPDNSTALHDRGGYFDLMPVDKGEETRKDIVISLEKMGFEVEAAHHEVAPSQHEIDFCYDEAIAMADSLITFKTTTQTIAIRHGLNATFMPKPYANQNGSGMHTHISLTEGGKNCFYDPDNKYNISNRARFFIGGLLKHIDAVTALTNPTVNSYKRLVPGYEAPVNVSWGRHNRSALIRIPYTSTPETSTRVELRSPDPTANPYLAFAAMLKAGLDGIKNQIEPPSPVEEDIYEMGVTKKEKKGIDYLPGSLGSALDALEEDEVIQEAIGEHVFKNFIRAKRSEEREYDTNVTNWEIEKYMKYY